MTDTGLPCLICDPVAGVLEICPYHAALGWFAISRSQAQAATGLISMSAEMVLRKLARRDLVDLHKSVTGWAIRWRDFSLVPLPAAQPYRLVVVKTPDDQRRQICAELTAWLPILGVPAQVVGDAATAEAVLEYWAEWHPDLVLAGQMLAGDIPGVQLGLIVRDLEPPARLILYSGLITDSLLRQAERAGIVACVDLADWEAVLATIVQEYTQWVATQDVYTRQQESM